MLLFSGILIICAIVSQTNTEVRAKGYVNWNIALHSGVSKFASEHSDATTMVFRVHELFHKALDSPELFNLDPTTVNDESITRTLTKTFSEYFGGAFDGDVPITTIAEDFSILAPGRPYAFWHFGATDEKLITQDAEDLGRSKALAMNHSSKFAPVIHPTMQTGIDALCIAALTFLTRGASPKL